MKKGGFMEELSKTANDTGKEIGTFFSNGYNSLFGKKPESSYISTPSYSSPTYSSTGGKRRRTHRRMKGGNYTANTNLNNVASNAAPIEGINTPKPCNWVGGKRRQTRKHSHKRRRSHITR